MSYPGDQISPGHRTERRMWICGMDKKGTKQMSEKEEVVKRREEKLEKEESRRKKSEDEMERMFKRVSEISEDEDTVRRGLRQYL